MNDSEDADLEFLRQAALSSLLKKKNIPSTTNAVFYNPSAKPNLISIQPVKEEYYEENEDENNEFSTEYVIAEGLSVSSSDVDEIVEEVIVSEGDEGDADSSEGEDAVSVASKDSFDEILNSIEEEVKDTKSGAKDKANPKRRKPGDSSSGRDKQGNRETNRENPSSSSRRRSRSPINKRPYNRRPANDSRRTSPIRHLHNRRSRSRSPPPLRRRSPVNDRKDAPSSFENRRRTRTRSPAENRRPGTRSPIDLKFTRSPLDDRRLRGARSSLDGRKPRSRSPRRRSRSPINNNRRYRSPFVHENRRRRSRSPNRRRAIVDNNRRYGRRTRSRSPVNMSHQNEKKHSSKSPSGNVSKVSSLSEGDKNSTEGEDNVNGESSSSRKSQSPENKKFSDALKLNPDRSTARSDREREPYRRRPADNPRSTTHRDRRSRSRSPGRSKDGDRRCGNQRRTPVENTRAKRRKSQSKSPPSDRRNPKTRTPSPPRNLSKEEREVFEKRKRKFQANVNVSKLSGKIKLKSNKTENPERDSQEKNGRQTSCNSNSEKTEKIKVSDKKSELSSRLGAIVPEELQYTSETSNPTTAAESSPEQSSEEALLISVQEDEPIDSAGPSPSPDETKEDLRTKLQQKRATGIGRLFSVALQDTLSTSSPPEDSPKKSLKRKAPTGFN